MLKGKISLGSRFKHVFTHHPGLKIVSLVLAIMVWLYVRGKIQQ